MPELPEVETIKEGLKKVLLGKKIISFEILDTKRIKGNLNKIKNKKILGIKRRAKLLIIEFENKINLVIHLKMTGQLIYKDKKTKIAGGHQSEELFLEVPNKFTRVIFNLSPQSQLFYNDLIRYGEIRVLTKEETEKILKNEFGPEPFEDFSLDYFKNLVKKYKNSNIKKLLMDQKKIAGVGNIYSNEALFYAHINPKRKAGSLSEEEIKNLFKGILKALKIGIKYEGASIRNYVNHKGEKGKMQNFFKVYEREGKKCSCGGIIKKIQLGGRGTYFCPKCQK